MKRGVGKAGKERGALTALLSGAVAFGTLGAASARAAAGPAGTGQAPQAATERSKGAAPSPPVAVEQERLVAGPFTVDSVDRSARKVTVRGPDGTQTTIDVSPNATGFDNLKPGDRVDLDYYSSTVVGLKPSRGATGESMEAPSQPSSPPSAPGAASSSPASAANRSMPAAGAASRQINASVQVTSVDPQRGTIQFKNAAGQPQTLQVKDPAVKQALRGLKPGDRVDVTYTAPVAMSIRPSSAR
jgi:hypothetical protein